MTISEIRELIAKGQFKQAVIEFRTFDLTPKIESDLIELSGKLEILHNKEIIGSISDTDSSIQRAGLLSDFMNLIRRHENPALMQEDQPDNIQSVLFLYANPGKSELRFSQEIRAIEDALRIGDRQQNFKFKAIGMVQANELQYLMRDYKPTILHLSLHSSLTKGLLFEDKNRLEFPLQTNEFEKLIKLVVESYTKINCVIVNACNSLEFAKKATKHVSYAIGHRDFIPDEAATIFTQHFYESLFGGDSIETAFGNAVFNIKIAKFEQGNMEFPVDEIPVFIKAKPIKK